MKNIRNWIKKPRVGEEQWSNIVNELRDFKFNHKKIQKLDKIARNNVQLRSFLRKVQAFTKLKGAKCKTLEQEINCYITLKTNFKLIKAIAKSRTINKQIQIIVNQRLKISEKLNLIHKCEDYIRLLLSQLKELFSQIQVEFTKTSDSLGRKRAKIKKEVEKTLQLFKKANKQLDYGDFDNLKNLYIQICTKLKFWCKTIPYLVTGVIIVDKLMRQKYCEVMDHIWKSQTEKVFTSEISKLNYYCVRVKKAIDDLNFYEITNGIDDYFVTADRIISWFKWQQFAKSEFQSKKQRAIALWNNAEQYYFFLANKISVLKKTPWIKQWIHTYQIKLFNCYTSCKKKQKMLFGGYDGTQSSLFGKRGEKVSTPLYIGKLKSMQLFLLAIHQFTMQISNINKLINQWSYYDVVIYKTIDNLQKYIIYTVNNFVKFNISNRESYSTSLWYYSLQLAELSKKPINISVNELQALYVEVQTVQKKVMKLFMMASDMKKKVKQLGLRLQKCNNEITKFYTTPATIKQAHLAFTLYEQKKYSATQKILSEITPTDHQ